MKFKSKIYEVIYQSALEKFKIGALSKERMTEYDKICLEKEPKSLANTEKSVEMVQTSTVSCM